MDVGAPAVVAAIHDAVGVWITELPATPERILEAMGALDSVGGADEKTAAPVDPTDGAAPRKGAA